jgi:hypothetical protein
MVVAALNAPARIQPRWGGDRRDRSCDAGCHVAASRTWRSACAAPCRAWRSSSLSRSSSRDRRALRQSSLRSSGRTTKRRWLAFATAAGKQDQAGSATASGWDYGRAWPACQPRWRRFGVRVLADTPAGVAWQPFWRENRLRGLAVSGRDGSFIGRLPSEWQPAR